MQSHNGKWKLVLNIKDKNNFAIEVLERNKGEYSKRVISQDEPAFYVGADIWELNYGATLKTLNHDSLAEHPAQQLWQDWRSYNQNRS